MRENQPIEAFLDVVSRKTRYKEYEKNSYDTP
jgi:hypothetical protein